MITKGIFFIIIVRKTTKEFKNALSIIETVRWEFYTTCSLIWLLFFLSSLLIKICIRENINRKKVAKANRVKKCKIISVFLSSPPCFFVLFSMHRKLFFFIHIFIHSKRIFPLFQLYCCFHICERRHFACVNLKIAFSRLTFLLFFEVFFFSLHFFWFSIALLLFYIHSEERNAFLGLETIN